MRKQRKNVGGSSLKGLLEAGHLPDETLLQSLDDELSQKDASLAEAHLYSCWFCRARREEISHAIAAIVEHQNAVAAPYLPPPPDDRRIFLARLDALTTELGNPFPFEREIQRLFQFMKSAQRGPLAWAAAALLLVVTVTMFYDLRKPHIVSAKELLDLAAASEENGLKARPQSVVIQKVRVQVNGKTLTNTIYRDVAHHRVASRTDAAGQDAADVKEIFLRSSFGWDTVLDPDAYGRWRASLPNENDSVEHVGGDMLRLETRSAAGPVVEASLTVRTNDFHAVEESLRLRDNAQIQVVEESWVVVENASVPSDIFGPAEAEPPGALTAGLPLITNKNSLPRESDLANSEMEAQSALHDLGADLGEQIGLTIRPDRVISIDGVLSDDARKRQLTDALQGIHYVQLHLLTVDEAAAQEEQTERRSGANQLARTDQPLVQLAASAAPLLESQLRSRFPDKDQRIQYVNQTLSLAQLASGRAWALNRLADQYPPEKIALLNGIERSKLHMLLTDHISALREDTSALLNQLGQILSLTSNTPAVNASVADLASHGDPDKPQASDDWQNHIRRIHSSVDVVHESISTLLAGSPDSDKDNVDTIELNLRTALNRLQVELQISDQQIRRTVAAPRETDR
jgi:anti-sigma factor RsiW